MPSGYLLDILAQPDALAHSIAGLSAQRFRPATFSRLVLTGMGSSYHAFQPTLVELTESGFAPHLVESSELVYSRPGLVTDGTLLVVLSQSGRSAEIVRVAEAFAGRAHIVALTNDPSSPLATAAQSVIELHAGSEATVSTKTYLASLAALAWFSDSLRGVGTGQEIAAIPSAVRSYLAHWERHVDDALHALTGIDRMYLGGRGASLASAGQGGLITKEAAHFPCEGMSAPAFRHGPYDSISPSLFLGVFEGAGPTAATNARLVDDVRSLGGRSALIARSPRGRVFDLPDVPDRFLPMLEILPVQMMTLALARLDGREAGVFSHGTKVTVIE